MDITRRELLAGMGGLAATSALRGLPVRIPEVTVTPLPTGSLPARGDFAIPAGQTYLNCAFIHPVPVAAADAVRHFLRYPDLQRAAAPQRRLPRERGEGRSSPR